MAFRRHIFIFKEELLYVRKGSCSRVLSASPGCLCPHTPTPGATTEKKGAGMRGLTGEDPESPPRFTGSEAKTRLNSK